MQEVGRISASINDLTLSQLADVHEYITKQVSQLRDDLDYLGIEMAKRLERGETMELRGVRVTDDIPVNGTRVDATAPGVILTSSSGT